MHAILLVLALVTANEPIVSGPEKVPAGRLAVFTVTCADTARTMWRVFPPDGSNLSESDVAAIFENNRKVAFASPVPGRYRLVVAVADGEQVYLIATPVVVEGPSPPTPPDPEPGPTPPTPSAWADWARRVAQQTVSEPYLSQEGPKVAAALRSVCDAVQAGRITDMRRAREAVRQAVREALGTMTAIRRWQSFSDQLDERMDAEQSKLQTLNDYVSVWKQVAEGVAQWR